MPNTRKVKPVTGLLAENSWEYIKEVGTKPTLHPLKNIKNIFTKETLVKLRIGGSDFLLLLEEEKFRAMLKKHGKAFSFSRAEIGCVDSSIIEPIVIFNMSHGTLN